MKLKESKTYNNLARAFAGECQARTRYQFCAYGFRTNQYEAIAQIIDKIAFQEYNHARMIYTYLQDAELKQIDNINIDAGFPFKEKWELEDNLNLLAEDENSEASVYEDFIATAKQEGFEDIATLFNNIMNVEIRHKKVFKDLYNQFKKGRLYKKSTPVLWKCSSCGYVSTGKEAWDECPLCKAKQGFCEVILPSDLW